MKTLLLQNMLYTPALGGANRANRFLLEDLVKRGYTCCVVAPALGSCGAQTASQFDSLLATQNITILSRSEEACVFICNSVEIHAVFDPSKLHRYAAERMDRFEPHLTLVSSQDPGQNLLLAAASCGKAGLLIYLLHAQWDLPFGPGAIFPSSKNTEVLQRCAGIVTVSNYLKNHVKRWGDLDATVIPFPVYRTGIFSASGRFGDGFVTLINPSAAKGISIFLSLAEKFPELPFAAVPTWATTEHDRKHLRSPSNVHVLNACENIDEILRQTQILLLPSLVPEGFGLIAVEAMLRGIPVIASNAGGLPEAKLGVDYVLPVSVIENHQAVFDERRSPISIVPPQNIGPWESALKRLAADREHYTLLANNSRAAAAKFVAGVGVESFIAFFEELRQNAPARLRTLNQGQENRNTAPLKALSSIKELSPERRALLALRALNARKKEPPRQQKILPRRIAAPEMQTLPLSFAQERLWFLEQMAPGNGAYNSSASVRIKGPLNISVLERCLSEIVRRHEVLRTNFESRDDHPVAIVHPAQPVKLEVTESVGEEELLRIAATEAQRPFDLGMGAVMRVRLVRVGEREHVLMMVMHHIAFDGWSMGVMNREVGELYEAMIEGREAGLEEMGVQYGDYAVWQRGWLKGEVMEEQMGYWREQLRGVERLELATDHRREERERRKGSWEEVVIGKEELRGMKELGRREGATLFMVISAVLKVLLHRYSGQEDIVVGSPIANRNHPEIEGLIGFFANTLALRTRVEGGEGFVEVLRREKEVTLGGYAHQDVPFEQLVAELRPERVMGYSPIFEVMLVLQNAPRGEWESGGLKFEVQKQQRGSAKFDLLFEMQEEQEELKGVVEYDGDLYERETIERMIGHWVRLMRGVVREPERAVGELELLSEEEKRQLKGWGVERAAGTLSAVQWFERQAREHGGEKGWEEGLRRWSCRELEEWADGVGSWLLGADGRVGLCVETGAERAAGMLGIWKAGRSCVLLEAEYPAELMEWMLNQAGVRQVLTVKRWAGRFGGREAMVMEEIEPGSGPKAGTEVELGAEACVIYRPGQKEVFEGTAYSHEKVAKYLEGSGVEGWMGRMKELGRGLDWGLEEGGYVLDEAGNLAPVGVYGRLHWRAEGVLGCVNEAEWTAEKFVPDKWSGNEGGRLYWRGERARRLRDGNLEYGKADRRTAVVGRQKIDLEKWEELVLAEEAVEECYLMERKAGGGAELVVYVVGEGAVEERVARRLEKILPVAQLPRAYVRVKRLPLDRRGRVEENKLERLEVIESGLAERWQEQACLEAAVEEAVVVAVPRREPREVLHLKDLWAGAWELKAAGTSAVSAEAMELKPGEEAAWSRGGELQRGEAEPRTMVEALRRTAAQHGERGIHYVNGPGPEDFQSYRQLWEEAVEMLGGLQELGLKAGSRVIFQIETLREHFTAFWACVLGGMKPVTVAVAPTYREKNGVVNKLQSVWQLLGEPLIVTSRSLETEVKGLQELWQVKGLRVVAVEELRGKSRAGRVEECAEEETLFLQLSSGSTGVPKCIQVTHRGVVAHVQGSRQFNEYEEEDVSLNWLAVDHVVPILTYHLKDVYMGSRQVQVRAAVVLAEPLKWLDLIEEHRVTHTWAPNFGFKLLSQALAREKGRRRDLGSVKYWMNAGEQVTEAVVEEFLRSVSSHGAGRGTMQPAFGMAEACTCMTYQNEYGKAGSVHRVIKSSLGGRLEQGQAGTVAFVDLGPPIPGVEIRITDAQNRTLPEGVIGRLQIRGAVITPGYLNNEEANRQAFVGEGWFNSGDLGFIHKGRLTLTGREKEMIIIRGANYYCYEIEDVINQVEEVEPTFAAACAIYDESSGSEGLALFYVLREQAVGKEAEIGRKIKGRVAAELGMAAEYVIAVARTDFPKTTSGKIQRGQLARGLAAGTFDRQIRQMDVEQENERTVPGWFYRVNWRRHSLGHLREPLPAERYLILSDEEGLGRRLKERLGAGRCILVHRAERFERQADGEYRMDLRRKQDYGELIQALQAEGTAVGHILHLWTYQKQAAPIENVAALRQAQDQGIYSLLYLVQALAGLEAGRRPAELTVISSHAQAAPGGGPLAPEKGTLGGMLKTLNQELNWLKCRQLDLEGEPGSDEPRVLQELRAWRKPAVVAWRRGERWVPVIEPMDLLKEPAQEAPIERHGIYLITGGLGGIGSHVAHYLIEHYEARLVLIGRTALPPRDQWEEAGAADTVVARRIRAYQQLEAGGGQIQYETVDVCDLAGLEAAVARAQSRWDGPLRGIMHLAGEGNLSEHWEQEQSHRVTEEQRAAFERMFHSKVYGSWTLQQLQRRHGQVRYLSFSSVNGIFGGASFSAYSAANSYLETQVHSAEGTGRSQCVSWSMWQETGMSQGNPAGRQEAARAMGYHILPPAQAIHSLMAVLSRDCRQVIIGLDGQNRHMERHIHNHNGSPASQELAGYVTGRQELDLERFNGLRITDRYETPSECRWAQVSQMPRMADGEIDRQQLVKQGGTGRRSEPAGRALNAVEEQIARIWQELLGVERIGLHERFFELGGHSLLAAQVMSRIKTALGVELPVKELFEGPTIAALARKAEQARGQASPDRRPELKPANRTTNLPLSYAQERLWLLHQMDPEQTAYNIAGAVRLTGPLDQPALERTLSEILHRHEILRTRFPSPLGLPVQVIEESAELPLEIHSLHGVTDSEAMQVGIEEARRPFDLARGSLIRTKLIPCNKTEHVLFFILHHIIADGWSMGVLIREFSQLYTAFSRAEPPQLKPLPLQYADYAVWQRQWLRDEVLEKQLAYWKNQLRGAPERLQLPTDSSTALPCEAAECEIILSREIIEEVLAVGRQEEMTLYMILMAALAISLHRWAGAPEMVIGTVVAGRDVQEVEDLIGCFMNFLPLRISVSDAETGTELLRKIKKTLLEAQTHSECPFERIVGAVNPDRKAAQNPLYNVAFLLQNLPIGRLSAGSLEATVVPVKTQHALLDIRFIGHELPEGVKLVCEYRADLFKPGTMEALLAFVQKTLERLVQVPLNKISGYELPQALTGSKQPDKETLAIAATFTAEPVEEIIRFWFEELGINAGLKFAPYNQVFQQLVDPRSMLGTNRAGLNIILCRLSDWHSKSVEGAGERLVEEFVRAVETARAHSPVSFLVCICPEPASVLANAVQALEVEGMERSLAQQLNAISGVTVVTGKELFELYPVPEYEDVYAEELAHIPYSRPFFSALGTMVIRRFQALRRGVFKAVVLDCDHTLWSGVCGEDGPEGVVLDEPRRALQEFMAAQKEAGMLLCLCSRNQEEDVKAVFSRHTGWPLKWNDFVATQINWNSKSDNLRKLAGELQVGLDSFVFIDDNPVECAQVEADCPEVLVLQLPEAPDRIPGFFRHCWAFDRLKSSAEDAQRTQFYLQEQSRRTGLSQSVSFATFLAELDLKLEIAVVSDDQIGRVAQLTQRVNQFNFTTRRWNEGELDQFSRETGHEVFTVNVSDRFGDYGLVGAMLIRTEAATLKVDTFVLSCRALGKGVEHQMLARLGEIALSHGVDTIIANAAPSVRNAPALNFLESLGNHFRKSVDAGWEYRFPAVFAAALRFEPSSETLPPIIAESEAKPVSRAAINPSWISRYRWIAAEAFDVERILAVIEARVKKSGPSQARYTAPRSDTEKALCRVWEQLLRREPVGVRDDFFDLGGDSLLAAQLMSRVRETFGVALPLKVLFETSTVGDLAIQVDERRGSVTRQTPPLTRVHSRDNLPLSYAQERLWFLQHLEPNGTAYNVSASVRLYGSLQMGILERTINEIVRRHETLRTRFEPRDSGTVQVIDEPRWTRLPVVDLSELNKVAADSETTRLRMEEEDRPFDLGMGAVMRVRLVRVGEREHVLMMVMHHIAFDGWSMGVMNREVGELYEAMIEGREAGLEEMGVQYGDYAVWQRGWLKGEVMEEQMGYWREQLRGVERLELATDHRREERERRKGSWEEVVIGKEELRGMKELGRREGATLFMVISAVLKVLLHRYSGQEDIVVGSPIANRNHPEIEGLIGFFANTLALRTRVEGGEGFVEVLRREKEVTLGGYAHQDVPFEQLVAELRPERVMGYSPIFEVMLVLQNAPRGEWESGGLKFEVQKQQRGSAKFDLLFEMQEEQEELKGVVEYDGDLYERETIERMIGHWVRLMRGVVREPERAVGELELLSEEEKRQLKGWGVERAAGTLSAVQWFERQAREHGGEKGWEEGLRRWSCRELEEWADGVGSWLLGADGRVGLCVETGAERAAGMLGIWKAGRSCVLLEAEYPAELMEWMLNQAGVRQVLTVKRWAGRFGGREAMVMEEIEPGSGPKAGTEVELGAEACVIYRPGQKEVFEGTAYSHEKVAKYLEGSGVEGWMGRMKELGRGLDWGLEEGGYVLDEAGNLAPVGVYGRLHWRAEGVLGCVNEAEWTAEKFVPDKWSGNEGGRLYWRGERARRLRDGNLEYGKADRRTAVVGRQKIDLEKWEELVLAEEAVEECYLMERKAGGGAELVVYVVGEGAVEERVARRLEKILPVAQLPRAYVRVKRLPLDRRGRVEENKLERLEVIESGLAERWQEQACLEAAVEEAVVVAVPRREPREVLHLKDLWAGAWELKAAGTSAVSAEAMELKPGEEAAWSRGGELQRGEAEPRTMVEALRRTAAQHGERGIHYVNGPGPEDFQSYRQLWEEAVEMLGGLQELGLKAGSRVIFQIETLREHFTAFWACVLGGMKPVTVAVAPTYREKNGVVNKLQSVWQLLGEPLIVTSRSLETEVKGLQELWQVKGLRVVAVEELRGKSRAGRVEECAEEETLFLQLSSGSTGVPKCIQVTHRGVVAHVQGSRQFNEYEEEDVSLNWLAVDHVVPILTYHLKDVYMGSRQVQVRAAVVLAEPLKWLDLIEEHRVTHTWAPNFGFKLLSQALAREKGRRRDLGSVKYWMNAGEQVTEAVVEEFLRSVSSHGAGRGTMQPAFGMAEACTCMTYQNEYGKAGSVHRVIKSSLGGRLEQGQAGTVAFVDLGPPIPGVEIRITDAQNRTLPEGVIGRLQIRGAVITPGYLNNEEANRQAFVGEGWFNSGDLGFIHKGRLTLTGREKEMIIIRGANYYCYEIEDVINQVEEVEPTFAAACAIYDESSGSEGLALFYVLREQAVGKEAEIGRKIKGRVAAELGMAAEYVIAVARTDFPKTTSGKIQRGQLARGLAAGTFDRQIRQMDVEQENERTVPGWFYRVNWRRHSLGHLREPLPAERYLILSDEEGLGRRLKERLGAGRCILVHRAERFERQADGEYRMDLRRKQDYGELIQALQAEGTAVGHILHLWTYQKQAAPIENVAALRQAQDQGIYSLLYLVQALAGLEAGRRPAELTVISSHAQAAPGGGPLAPEKGTLGGMLKTLNQELNWLKCRQLDLEGEPGSDEPRVLQELRAWRKPAVVAWRRGERWVPVIEPMDLLKEPAQEAPIERHGIYLITGGLGGIGSHVAHYLIEHYEARLVLIGRTALPPRDQWEEAGAADTVVARRIRAYQQLEAGGGQIQYETVDVCDLAGLEAAVARAQSRWDGPLRGIMHLAGEGNLSEHWEQEQSHRVTEEQRAAFERMFHSKVYGSWTLQQLQRRHGQVRYLSFSSVNGIFGGASFSAYSAANSYLETQVHSAEGTGRSQCVSWSMWQETGMSQGNPAGRQEAARAMGYHILPPAQAIHSLMAVLSRDCRQVIIGLDGQNRHMERHIHNHNGSPASQELAGYVTGRQELDLERFNGLRITDRYETPSECRWAQVSQMPRMADGEIDRQQLVKQGGTGRRSEPAGRALNAVEEQIARIWQELLGVERIGLHERFFELGGHSLLAAQVMSRIKTALGVELPVKELFEGPTIAALARKAEQARGQASPDRRPELKPANRTTNLPLSYAQERLWFLDRLDPGNTAYNLPGAIRIEGTLDRLALERAINEIVRRHEVLRTTFAVKEGRPVQIIHPPEAFPLEVHDLITADRRDVEHLTREIAFAEAHRAFDLVKGPVVRAKLILLDEFDQVLLYTLHHIASDGWSMGILARELPELYKAFRAGRSSPLPELTLQYADYAVWQRAWLQGDFLGRQLQYWTEHLAGIPVVLELPTDRPRAGSRTFTGGTEELVLDGETTAQLRALGQANGSTLFMTLLTIFKVLLYRLASEPDIVVGSPVANRSRPETEGLIGFFVNTIVFRTDLAGNPTFQELLQQVRKVALDAYSNQDLPFEKLVEKLNPQRSIFHTPVFQVYFSFMLAEEKNLQLPGAELRPWATDVESPKFDLGLYVIDQREELSVAFQYRTELFNAGTIRQMLAYFQNLCRDAITGSDKRILSLQLMEKTVQANLLDEFNDEISLV